MGKCANPSRTSSKKRKQRKRSGKKSSKKTVRLEQAIKRIKRQLFDQLHKRKPDNVNDAIKVALNAANQLKNKIQPSKSRVIPIPKVGGILPLIPIFAGLSALGSLTGGAAGVYKAISDAKSAKNQLDESNRHNRAMESIAMGKGLYLKPYKQGLGIFLRPYQKRNRLN